MAFMLPTAQYFTIEEAQEYVTDPATADGSDPDPAEAGWYSRLSAPGYMDCTDWGGPFNTFEAASKYVRDLYEVDENGDDLPEEPPKSKDGMDCNTCGKWVDFTDLGSVAYHEHSDVDEPWGTKGVAQ